MGNLITTLANAQLMRNEREADLRKARSVSAVFMTRQIGEDPSYLAELIESAFLEPTEERQNAYLWDGITDLVEEWTEDEREEEIRETQVIGCVTEDDVGCRR